MRIDNEFLYLEPTDYIPKKKISGHTFVALCGLDPFKKQGDALLELHRFIKPEVDPKWLRRGTVAEQIVASIYKKDHQITTYDAAQIGYDNFKDNPNFGGIIDIEVDNKTLVEVKSKSLDKKFFIVNNPPQAEIYQAMLYAYLRGYEYFTMEWIFFDKETEEEIFADKKPTTLKNLDRYTKVYFVDKCDIEQKMKVALNFLEAFKSRRPIPLRFFSDDVISKIKEKIANE